MNTKQSQKICFNGLSLGLALRQQNISPENFFGIEKEVSTVVYLIPTSQQGLFGLNNGGLYN